MPKINQLQTNFTAGEFSTLMLGRVDYARYVNSVKRMRDCYSFVQGGAQRREGLAYVGNAAGIESRLIPFVFDSLNAYVLEITEAAIRIYKNRVEVALIPSVYTVASDFMQIRYTQSANTMIFTHPSFPPKKLIRKSDTEWDFLDADFTVPPLKEAGVKPGASLTVPAATGTAVFTASASVFLAADVGRQITAGSGIGLITAQTGTTATVNILRPFTVATYISQDWTILDSPVSSVTVAIDDSLLNAQPAATLSVPAVFVPPSAGNLTPIIVTVSPPVFTPGDVGRQISAGTGSGIILSQSGGSAELRVLSPFSAAGAAVNYTSGQWSILDSPTASPIGKEAPKGAKVSLTSNIASWRSSDVGSYVSINEGVVLITQYVSTVLVRGVVQKKVEYLDVAYGGGWRLQQSAFSSAFGYPVSVAMFEGRLVFGGTKTQPNTLWISKTNNIADFALGTGASDAMEWQVTSDRQDQIMHLVPSRSLMVHTYSGEFAVYGSDSGPITPTSTIIRLQTTNGSGLAAPELIGQTDVFVQRSGKKIRAAGYDVNKDGFLSMDISEVAEHIFRVGVVDLAYSAEPVPRLYAVLNDGTWACGTYSQDQSVMAWSLNSTPGGEAVSVCAVPSASAGLDEVYMVVKRGAQSGVEVFDQSRYHDQGGVFTSATDVTQITVAWLANKTVALTIDGQWAGEYVADGAGVITLPFTGKVINYGLLFTALIELLPPEFQIDATIQGKNVGVSNIMARVLETEAIKINGQQLINRSMGNNVLNAAMPRVTGDYDTSAIGVARNGQAIIIEQGNPSPFHVLAVRRTLTVND